MVGGECAPASLCPRVSILFIILTEPGTLTLFQSGGESSGMSWGRWRTNRGGGESWEISWGRWGQTRGTVWGESRQNSCCRWGTGRERDWGESREISWGR
jgi:hypothetical protein